MRCRCSVVQQPRVRPWSNYAAASAGQLHWLLWSAKSCVRYQAQIVSLAQRVVVPDEWDVKLVTRVLSDGCVSAIVGCVDSVFYVFDSIILL